MLYDRGVLRYAFRTGYFRDNMGRWDPPFGTYVLIFLTTGSRSATTSPIDEEQVGDHGDLIVEKNNEINNSRYTQRRRRS